MVRSFFTIYSMARLRRARPSGPGRAPSMGAGSSQGQRWTGKGSAAGGSWWRGVSPLGAAAQARCLSVWGRTARAAAAAPFPRARRQAVPAVTHPPVDRACGAVRPSSRAGRAVTAKAPCQGRCGLRPPRPSASLRATPDRELPRQDQALAGRTGKVRNTHASGRGLEQCCATVAGQEAAIAPHHGRAVPP
jgi:hypothetical protein